MTSARSVGPAAGADEVDRVGWYGVGPVTGSAGDAVPAGHVDDAAHGLGVLVTCGGQFLPGLHNYRDNVFVVAEPVP